MRHLGERHGAATNVPPDIRTTNALDSINVKPTFT